MNTSESVNIMVDEHKYIKRVLAVIRKFCIGILNGTTVDFEAFEKIIDFVRNFADKHHHAKEEDILFQRMSQELGQKVATGPIYGMLSEHGFGRLFITNLEAALQRVKDGDNDAKVDIIANAIGYTDLLNRHIDKEDTALYQFALRNLSQETLNEVDEASRKVEDEAVKHNIINKYHTLVSELESRV